MNDSKTTHSSGLVRGQPRWKKFLLVAAAVCVVVGLALKGVAMMRGGDEAQVTNTAGEGRSGALSTGTSGLVGSGDGGSEAGAADADKTDWSPFFFKGGFGFFLGFCVGHFLRAFLKVSAVGIGLIALVVLGLQYAGVLEVDWNVVSDQYDKIAEVVRRESKEFFSFVNGTIPAASASGLGLLVGFKKK